MVEYKSRDESWVRFLEAIRGVSINPYVETVTGESLMGRKTIRCFFGEHEDKTPSMHVYSDHVRCFQCERSAGPIGLMKLTGLSGRDAVREVARREGLEYLLKFRRDESGESQQTLTHALEEAANRFQENLFGDDKKGINYLRGERAMSPEDISEWRLGYAPPSWHSLKEYLLDRGIPIDVIAAAGLVKRKNGAREKSTDSQDYYDFFRDRLIFPLFDQLGRIVGFAGRDLSGDVPDKYRNSPEKTEFGFTGFKKGTLLYGLHKAIDSIRKSGEVYVVEGYTDKISTSRVIPNLVAIGGTALTDKQLESLKRIMGERRGKVIALLDGDRAGIEAAQKSAGIVIRNGLEFAGRILSGGKDPDDIVTESGEEQFLKEVQESTEHNFSSIHLLEPHETPMEKDSLLRKVMSSLGPGGDFPRSIIYLEDFSKRLGVSPQAAAERFYSLCQKSHGPVLVDEVRMAFTDFLVASLAESAKTAMPLMRTIDRRDKAIPEDLGKIFDALVKEYEDERMIPVQNPIMEVGSEPNLFSGGQIRDALSHLDAVLTREGLTMPCEVVARLSRPETPGIERAYKTLIGTLEEEKRRRDFDELERRQMSGEPMGNLVSRIISAY